MRAPRDFCIVRQLDRQLRGVRWSEALVRGGAHGRLLMGESDSRPRRSPTRPEEWLRFIQEDHERKPSTVHDYRSALDAHLLPAFGALPVEAITPELVESWRRSLSGLSNRTKNKLLVLLHGIFRRAQTVYRLPTNPLALVEKHPQRSSGDSDVFSPEEVWALVRAAASEQDAAIYLTAAFTGLRKGEPGALVARPRLRRRGCPRPRELRGLSHAIRVACRSLLRLEICRRFSTLRAACAAESSSYLRLVGGQSPRMIRCLASSDSRTLSTPVRAELATAVA